MENVDAYSRGTLLGLTVAEIFILLVFLLLLIFLGLEDERTVQEEKQKSDLTVLGEWKPIINEFKTPEKVRTLVKQTNEAMKQAEEQIANLEGKNTDLEQKLEDAQAENNILTLQENEATHSLKTLREKGHNPPCWYARIPRENGGDREQAHYIFNMAVHDDGIIVQRRPPPPGRAEDDNGLPYTEEAQQLGIDAIPYGTKLSDAQVKQHFHPLHQRGKQKKVRTYSCVFSVSVWDMTSSDAKVRWKDAHDKLLEGLFATYSVKDDPWPADQ